MIKYIQYAQRKRLESMNILKYKTNDIIELKKQHPCGSTRFRILRVGSTMRISCEGCARDMEIDRIKLEKATRKIITQEEKSDNASN